MKSGEKHHRKFQTLSGVHSHDAHRVYGVLGRRIDVARVGIAHQVDFFHELREGQPG